jgi:hypothetical protein
MFESEDTALKEVVVIGYKKEKIDNTTAITSLKAEEVSKMKKCLKPFKEKRLEYTSSFFGPTVRTIGNY